ncbi:MAG: DUF4403 family protein [Terrimonas sp.]|nr:DUF4403 family protein [Terrimonas sp.]
MAKSFNFIFVPVIALVISSCSKKIIPDKPLLSQTNFKLDSLPYSEINIPIQIDLKPIYALAENNVDTVFTSPHWPEDWVQSACDTRYKYQFRRGPLQLSASGNTLNLDFTGYYKIIGSSRLCLGNAVLSPWTTPCKCGFAEGERRVKVGFSTKIDIKPDYQIQNTIFRRDPLPIDKCTVCFWGQDITNQVMKGMIEELEGSKKAIIDSFGLINIQPQIQALWNQINMPKDLYGLGWLKINPLALKLFNLYAKNDSLNINLGLSARPVLSFEKPEAIKTLLPNLTRSAAAPGFNIFLDAQLNYDSLSNILNSQLKGKSFDFKKGPLKKHIILNETRIYGTGNEKLVIKINFSGSAAGTAYLTGKPYYDLIKRELGIRDLDFDIKTKTVLVKTAEWLFNRGIINEIAKSTRFSLSEYIDTSIKMANAQMNREWVNGIFTEGRLDKLDIIGIYPLGEKMIIRSNLNGILAVKVGTIAF